MENQRLFWRAWAVHVAVVAGEIKELARQTSDATEEIKQQIDSIQESIRETVGEIKDIEAVVGEVNRYVNTIAGSVDDQVDVTREITHNVNIASRDLGAINERVNESSSSSEGIAADMDGVKTSSKGMIDGCAQIKSKVEALAGLAGNLEATIQRFKYRRNT